jgi:hypothetical protein
MILLKNIKIFRSVKAAVSVRQFNFKKLQSSPRPTYQIDVSDDRGNRHFFCMELVNGQWKIQWPLIVNWIQEAELLLHEAILRRETQI